MWTDKQQKQFRKLGYFIADNALECNMLEELLAATRRVKQKVRNGEVDVYTDWNAPGEPFNIVGLISPEFDEPIFGQYMASGPIASYVRSQLGNNVRIGWLGLFTNPHHKNFTVAWHRDVGKEPRDLPEKGELEFLRQPRTECRWELALVDDCCLYVVPGSHLRYRTETEWDIMNSSRDAPLPDEVQIHLKAGHTLFWNGKLIHRAVHQKDSERLTLAVSWHKWSNTEPKQEIGRSAWMLAADVRAALPESLHPYYDRWKAIQEF